MRVLRLAAMIVAIVGGYLALPGPASAAPLGAGALPFAQTEAPLVTKAQWGHRRGYGHRGYGQRLWPPRVGRARLWPPRVGRLRPSPPLGRLWLSSSRVRLGWAAPRVPLASEPVGTAPGVLAAVVRRSLLSQRQAGSLGRPFSFSGDEQALAPVQRLRLGREGARRVMQHEARQKP